MQAPLDFLLSTDEGSPDGVLIEHAKRIKDEPIEYGYVFDKNGRLLRSLRGERLRIQFGQRDLFCLSNTMFMHNHPHGTSFSLSDIHAACMLNMLAMIAVTPTMLFCMTPPDDEPYFVRVHYRDIALCYTIRCRLMPLSKRLKVQDAVWDHVAKDMNMQYRKVPLI